ncbi:MAG: type II toxin-antitoxin system VapC family toxin [Chthoniobacter sp.]|nr:type II toxin-antitoxin system VapC family toxin [Chthoniobacter sp.]
MILDTNAISALSFDDADLVSALGTSLRHHLPVIVIGEYEYGIAGSRRNKELKEWFDLLVSESIVLTVERDTATHYGTISAALKKKGTPIPSNDLWIAALAVQHGLPIVSQDKHFDLVPGIRRVAW